MKEFKAAQTKGDLEECSQLQKEINRDNIFLLKYLKSAAKK